MIQFICGCDSKLEPPISRENFKTFDAIVEDHEGYLICFVHRERLKGWRSVPYRDVLTASMTPLEYERWKIFGEFPKQRTSFTLLPDVEDRRDNRDPEELGREILGRHNGKVEVEDVMQETLF